MKKILSVVAVAMFLCSGSAFAVPAGSAKVKGSGYGVDVSASADTKSTMKEVENKTKVENSTIYNEGGQLDVGVVANSAGGEMEKISNETTITNSEVINMGEEAKMRIGTVQN